MKTIKNASKKLWKRVSDAEAQSTVGRNGWTYCPKQEWKDNVRKPSEEKKKMTGKEKEKNPEAAVE